MSDPLIFLGEFLGGKALDVAGRVVRDVVAPPANPFEEIRRRQGAEANFEFGLALERHVRFEEARDAEFREKLREKITEREVGALFPQLLRAAAESSTRERMRMLCAALAGLWRPDLDAEMRSRVARAVMQLEASDILAMRRLERAQQQPGIRPAPRMTPELEPAVLTGCVADNSARAGFVAVELTTLGLAVLTALETWPWAPDGEA